MDIFKTIFKIIVFQANGDIKQVFIVVCPVKAFCIAFCKLLAKQVFKMVFTFEIDFLTLKCCPNTQLTAKLLTDGGKQIFEGIERADQMIVVHPFKRNAIQPNDKAETAVFKVNNVFSDVPTDFRQILLLRALLCQYAL